MSVALSPVDESSPRYAGWRVVAVCYLGAVFCWGLGLYGHGVYLTELNHLLGALRREQADDPARRPSPTLGELETLLDAARAAGVPADLTVEGGPRALSPGV